MSIRSGTVLIFFLVLCACAASAGNNSIPVSFINSLGRALTIEIDGAATCEIEARTSISVLPECIVRLATGDHSLKVTSSDGRTSTEQLSFPANSSRCYDRIVDQDGTLKTIAGCEISEAPVQK